MPAVWLVLPTYDEADNVEAIVRAACEQLSRTGRSFRVLVVDDRSPDGTGQIADRLAAELEDVEVLHRENKRGIGPAYLAGFRHALANDAELVLEMDADFSHDPTDLPRLIAAAEAADLVLGSRYVPGGGVTDWGRLRRGISRLGSLYAQLVLHLPVRDLTGGFKCFRRSVLETLDLDTVSTDGYGFQIEMTYRTVRAGFRVAEVPIIFRDRRVGNSKMSWQIWIEAFWKVPALPLRVGRGSSRSRLGDMH